MKERLVTSIGLVVFLLVVGFINNLFLTNLVIALITIAAVYEAKKLFDIKDERVFYFLTLMSVFAIFINPVFIAVVSVIAIAGYVAFYQNDIRLTSLAIYPFVPLMLLEELYITSGMKGLLWLIVIIALTDSMAYVIGKNFGNKFISQKFSLTSPNKTWEGVIGGVLSGTIIGSFAGLMFFDFLTSFIISFFVSVASVFGDLFESYLKRNAGVKDSGNILPGHGGVLDRVDGYLFGAPLMWALIISLGNI